MSVTTVDIARHLGLSQATVRHVLNGRAEKLRIREDTRRRVMDAAQELGYRPNASARAMSTGRSGSAAFIQPLRHMYLAPELLVGLSQGLEEANMHLSLAHVSDEVIGDEEFLPKIVREVAADGLFLNAAFDPPPSFVRAIESHRIPTIWINQRRAADCVNPDDFAGAALATRHLLGLGHERIAFAIANPTDAHYSVRDRQAGYEAAMREAGRTPWVYPLSVVPPGASGPVGDRRIERAMDLLDLPGRPTAILAYEIDSALPILMAAAHRGVPVPEALSLAMFHRRIDSFSGVPITAMLAGWEEIGRRAVGALREKIREPDRPLAPLAIAPILYRGGTCAPPSPSFSKRTGALSIVFRGSSEDPPVS